MMKALITRFLSLALPGMLALVFAGCAATSVQKTWTAPAVGSLKFTKVFVIAVARDDTDRRLAEIAVKEQIKRVSSVASYDVFPDISDTRDKAKVVQGVKDSGADGVIVLRLTTRDTKIEMGASTATPMEYMVFSDYYGAVYDVGAFYATDTRDIGTNSVYYVETRIFDAKTGKLVWKGETKSTKDSFHDHDVHAIVTEVAESIRGALQAQQLIP
ncbi:MAG: hypothetical protein WDM96_14110 [Lacunisphaera sp.]